ncbi:transmembrane protein 247 [Tiliqua scincoides]|uniref:transmembrane protein 247 n=1 Tax=Tiliqua scincoides TaxID=71010 RepID=UPI0034630FF2
MEAINSPLQPEVVTREEKNDQIKEQEQKSTKPDYGTNSELEKIRIDFELTVLKRQHEENERQRQHEEKMERIRQQRQHEEKMERLRQQAALKESPGGGHHLLLPQDQFTLFLYCFIFIHIIYIARELMFFFIKKHEMFAIGAILLCAIKTFWK